MAHFIKYLIMFLVIAACVGVLEVESAEADLTALGVRKMLDPPTEVSISLATEIQFKKELLGRLKGTRCGETCFVLPCWSAKFGCYCQKGFCYRNELTPTAAAASESE
uniref:Hedyotide B1 n=1 Tax=Leptopetalum biflorum TaxID=462684 RepID=G9I0X2_9GENT|nr:hedyotide B1 [Leptopetalum biflorum]AEX01722.1 hedyotide B1 [Leptopetalum biflorum]